MITPRIDLSSLNAIPPSTSAKSLKRAILSGKRRMYGSSITHGGCAPHEPEAAATQFVAYGQNHARFHHLEAVPDKDLPKVLAFADALYARGCRVSVSITSLIAKEQARYQGEFYADLYAGKKGAELVYWENFRRLRPLLSHPACFMAVLCNEPEASIQPDDAARFWSGFGAEVRCPYPDLIWSDGGTPDSWEHGKQNSSRTEGFAKVAQGYDVGLAHMYGDDAGAKGTGSWIAQPDYWRRILEFAEKSGRPLFINEFGSYAQNPHQGRNLAWFLLEARRVGASVCHYNWCDRPEHDAGGGNAFAILRDPFRQDMVLLGAGLVK